MRTSLFLLAAAASSFALFVACTDDDSSPAPGLKLDGGTFDATADGNAGDSASSDASGDTATAADTASEAAAFDAGVSTLRVELPCLAAHSGDGCSADGGTIDATFGGSASETFDVAIRVRGVAEPITYTGGTADLPFYVGGTPDPAGYNTFVLTTSAPAASYALNAGTSGPRYCLALDYTRTIAVSGGATLTLTGDARDGAQIINVDDAGTPNVVPGIPPAPAAFDGQFVQVDVVSVTPR